MAQSLSKVFIHFIVHIKSNGVKILEKDNDRLFAYIGSIIKDNESIPIVINGVEDHVDILCIMSKNIALAKLVEEVKRHSSRWIKNIDIHYKQFAWQSGYGGFSISPSLHDKTKYYIQNQKEHHKKLSFKEEYLSFLKEYGIEFNETYLWSD